MSERASGESLSWGSKWSSERSGYVSSILSLEATPDLRVLDGADDVRFEVRSTCDEAGECEEKGY